MNDPNPIPNFIYRLFLIQSDIKCKDEAAKIGVTPSCFSRKLHQNGSSFTTEEAKVIARSHGKVIDELFWT